MDKIEIGNTTFRLLQGDITTVEADAIVNAANSSLLGGGGVDGAIHRKGGPEILEACKQIRRDVYPEGLPTGEAVITTGGNLPAGNVIHTVGPIWRGGKEGEEGLLANAYRNALERARERGLRSIAFPSISTGAYGYPVAQAARIAIATIIETIRAHPDAFDEITMVLFSGSDYNVYADALAKSG